MSRNVSLTLKQAVTAQETAEVFIILLTIDHPDLSQPVRLSKDAVDTVSRGNTFIAFPFQLSLPEDTDERPQRARLTIDNVDQQILQTMRSIGKATTVLIEIILASDPDTVEASSPGFTFKNIQYDRSTVQGDLTLESFLAEPYPAQGFTPADFPGLF